jgi:hypothetical protein
MTELQQQADGTWKRVPVSIDSLIASKEELLLKVYSEIQELKALKGE